MKIFIALCLLGAVLGLPQHQNTRRFNNAQRVQAQPQRPSNARQFSQPQQSPQTHQRFSNQRPSFSAPQQPEPLPLQQPRDTFTSDNRPQHGFQASQNRDRFAKIIRSDLEAPQNGAFSIDVETDNGILISQSGQPGQQGQTNHDGTYSFVLDDGTLAEVNYIADEFGFRAESPLIPTPHPLPAHAIEQIRIAEQQRAQGITFQ